MTRIDHIAAYVEDLERARVFFEKYFGASSGEIYHNPRTGLRTYFLSFGDGARLEIMNRPGLGAPGGGRDWCGYAHLSFSVGSREAVDELTSRLADGGYAVVSGPRVTGDGYYESCVEAVEGLLVEITEGEFF